MDNLYRQTRGWRHDFKNHIQTMQAYLEMGQTKQLQNYLRELTEDYNTIDIALRTGNAMLDAILNSKLSIIKTKDIRTDVTAAVPSSLPVSDVDLSVMIGNLLDNAMEACLKVPPEQRFIRLYIAKAKDNLYIYVMNSADGAYRMGGGHYLSTKLSDSHGYGLQRIDKVIRKYKGTGPEGQKSYALKDFSLKLTAGERMAIVGMNGSGKTTMIKLLCRLYDPQEGEILLNGVDIRKFRQEEYMRLFAVVFQDFKLLALPPGENVAASAEVDAKHLTKFLFELAGKLRKEGMCDKMEAITAKLL